MAIIAAAPNLIDGELFFSSTPRTKIKKFKKKINLKNLKKHLHLLLTFIAEPQLQPSSVQVLLHDTMFCLYLSQLSIPLFQSEVPLLPVSEHPTGMSDAW